MESDGIWNVEFRPGKVMEVHIFISLVLTQRLISKQAFETFLQEIKIFGQKNSLFSPFLNFRGHGII